MRSILLLILLFNTVLINAQSQTIRFENNQKEPIQSVYLDFFSEGVPKRLVSDLNGIVVLKDSNRSLNIKISHIGFETINCKVGFKDTLFILKKKNFMIEEVFVTAQIKPTKKSETIQKVRLINRIEIENQAATNLKELLEKEMNMRLSNDNILGSSVSIQGISGQNVKILIDGIPVIGRLNGNIDLSQISLNNISRVEIIEGPLSVEYGTDALAGTINLITDQNLNDKFSSKYNIFYQSVGNYNTDISLSYRINEQSLALDFGRKYFDGWSDDEEFSLLPTSNVADTNRVKTWNPKEQYFGNLNYKINKKKNTLRIYFDSYYEKITNLGLPRMPYFETAFDDYYYTRRNNLGLEYNYDFSDEEEIELLLSVNDYERIKNTYFKDLTTLDQVLTNNSSDQDTSKFNLLMNKIVFSSFKSEKFNYQIGFDSKIENAKGKRINNNERSLRDYAIYISSKWNPYNGFAVKPGFRLSYNSKFNVPIIPSLNFMFNKKDLKVRFSYARGFRAPSLKELFFEFVDVNHNIIGNRDLSAEISNNFQFNIDYLNRFEFFKIEIGTKLFSNNIENLITLAQLPNFAEYTYFNLGKYKTRGVSASLNLLSEKINISLSASNIGRYNSLSENEIFDAEKNLLDFSYSSSYNASVNYTFSRYYLSTIIYYNYIGKLPLFYQNSNNEIIESEIASYSLLDFVLKKSFFSGKINLSFGMKNLFDVQEISSFSSSGAHSSSSNSQSVGYGRTFFTSLDFRL